MKKDKAKRQNQNEINRRKLFRNGFNKCEESIPKTKLEVMDMEQAIELGNSKKTRSKKIVSSWKQKLLNKNFKSFLKFRRSINLIEKFGDNYILMAEDHKNYYQQT